MLFTAEMLRIPFPADTELKSEKFPTFLRNFHIISENNIGF